MSEWGGEERRTTDRDLIVEIHTIVTRLDKSFDDHIKQDKEDFEKVHKRIGRVDKRIIWGTAIVTGAFGAIEFFKKKIFP